MLPSRIRRDIVQYGLTPDRIWFRLSRTPAPKVLANSIPKAGTNVLVRALYLIYPLSRKMMKTILAVNGPEYMRSRLSRLKRGQVAAAHVEFSRNASRILRDLNVRHVLMVRDPRDIAVSHFKYVTYKDGHHPLHKYYSQTLSTDDDRLLATLLGVDRRVSGACRLPSLCERIRSFADWADDLGCLVVRFEDLVGHKGGGDDKAQLETLWQIARHLGLDPPESEMEFVAANLFNTSSRTFEKGQIGSWKSVFRDSHREVLKCGELGGILRRLGYDD